MLLYSSIGRTSALNNNAKDLSSRYVKDRLMRPIIRFALETVRSACCLKVNSLSMVTPRCFSWSTTSKINYHFLESATMIINSSNYINVTIFQKSET